MPYLVHNLQQLLLFLPFPWNPPIFCMLLGVIGVQDYMLLPLFFCLVDNQNAEDMDGYVGFLAAVRRSYYKFVEDLSKKCKQTVQHHLDSVTSPYYHFPGVQTVQHHLANSAT